MTFDVNREYVVDELANEGYILDGEAQEFILAKPDPLNFAREAISRMMTRPLVRHDEGPEEGSARWNRWTRSPPEQGPSTPSDRGSIVMATWSCSRT